MDNSTIKDIVRQIINTTSTNKEVSDNFLQQNIERIKKLYNEPFVYGPPHHVYYIILASIILFFCYYVYRRKNRISMTDINKKRPRMNVFKKCIAYIIEGKQDTNYRKRPNSQQYQPLNEL